MVITLQVRELVLQALEHERGGVLIYETALECVRDEDLREVWEDYRSILQTQEENRPQNP